MNGTAQHVHTEQKRTSMKKIVFAGLIAIGAMALAQQQASAWVNSKFGIGLNWERQAGGNNFLWGAYRNGQPPGPEAFNGPGFAPAAPMPYYGPQHHGYAPMMPAPAPTFAPPPVKTATAEPPYSGGYASPFQFATYARPVYSQPEPTYYYPSYYYPSYYYYPNTTYYYFDR
jgi:hypothetical protein